MKKVIFAALLLCAAAGAEAKKSVGTVKAKYAVEAVAASQQRGWAVVGDLPEGVKGATVYVDGREVPSQLDDLDGDGRYDELVFGVEFAGAAEVEAVVEYSAEAVEHDYPALVNAQMWWKNPDKTLTEAQTLESDKDDMYHKLHHHGPAFESEYAAYRVYFDKKQSIDTYGKKRPSLELRETMWYPSDEQLEAGYGHDNLRVFGTISVGALKGWNAAKGRMDHITDMSCRRATVRAKGPLRTVVDMYVKGWKYCGREIDMNSRYILYGGGDVVKVENSITGEGVDSLEFVTGVMKMQQGVFCQMEDGRNTLLATVGRDFPENDTLKWERETTGLAVCLPSEQVAGRADDATSYMCKLRPVDGRIDYMFWMKWKKSEFEEDNIDENNTPAHNLAIMARPLCDGTLGGPLTQTRVRRTE